MNDEFLHALRRDPPPQFASGLKGRLDRYAKRRTARSSVLRVLLAAVAIGGAAMAAALLLRDRHEAAVDGAPIAHAVPAASAPKAVTTPGTPAAEQVAAARKRMEPQAAGSATEAEASATLVTSALARPLAQSLIENIGKRWSAAAPHLAILEADDAFAALCRGTDFVLASRRIAEAELIRCRSSGVEIVEWKLGYQAVVLTAGPTAESAALSPREVYLALARRIPDPADPSRLIDNPNATWHDVDVRFDWRTIDVLAPSDALVRDVFVQLVMEAGCETYPAIREIKKSNRRRYDEACHQLRTDGHYREVPLSNTFVTQQLWAEPNWLVLVDYSFYDSYRQQLLGTMLAGTEPTLASLDDGTYAAARPVYAYAANDRLSSNPFMRSLTFELTNGWAVGGPYGYLLRSGLIPTDAAARRNPDARPPAPLKPESLSATQENRR